MESSKASLHEHAVAAFFAAAGVIFLLYPSMTGNIITTDLFTKEMHIITGYAIAIFSLLTAIILAFPRLAEKIPLPNGKMDYRKIALLLLVLNIFIKLPLSMLVPQSFYYHDGAQYSSIAMHIYNGEGFVTSTLWDIMLRKEGLPFAETSRAPLVPYMIAGMYHIFGVSFFAEKLLFVLISSLIPALSYLMFRCISSGRVAFLGAVLLSFDWIIFTYSRVVHTELPFMLFTSLFLLALFSFRERWRDYAFIGAAFALAYLTRYQALYVFPLVALAYFYAGRKELKGALAKASAITLLCILLVSPWLLRNATVADGPFSSDLPYLIVGSYGGRDFSSYVYSLDTMPETLWSVVARDPLLVLKESLSTVAGMIAFTPYLVFSNPLLMLFAAAGAYVLLARDKKHALPLFAMVFLTYATLALTLPVARYLYGLIPVFALLAAEGAFFAWYSAGRYRFLVPVALAFCATISVILIGFAYSNLGEKGESSFGTYNLFNEFIMPNNLTNATFMVDSFPYFYEYYSHAKMKVLQFPYYSNGGEFYDYAKKYGVEYVVLHKDSILRVPMKLPGDFRGKKIFEDSLRIVYTMPRDSA